MAALTEDEKTEIRNLMEKKAQEMGVDLRWIKVAMDDTAQAVEDELQSAKTSISTAMDTASQAHGVTFTGAEKKKIGALVLKKQYEREFPGTA